MEARRVRFTDMRNDHASKNGGVEIRSISWPIYQMHVYRSFVPDEFRTGLTRDQ